MLVVVFAVISAALVVNGTFNLSFDDIGFTSNIIFSSAKTIERTAVINKNEQKQR